MADINCFMTLSMKSGAAFFKSIMIAKKQLPSSDLNVMEAT